MQVLDDGVQIEALELLDVALGSDRGEFLCSISMLSWSGHQSRFACPRVPPVNGHLPAFSSVFASMFLSGRELLNIRRRHAARWLRSTISAFANWHDKQNLSKSV
jgi:hypothetical protein